MCVFGCRAGYFTDVAADFQSKMPVIRAVAHHDGISCRLEIVVSNAECVKTSQLLAVYSQLDPRVRPLVITFRYWARVSELVTSQCACLCICFFFVFMYLFFFVNIPGQLSLAIHLWIGTMSICNGYDCR